VTQAKKIQAIKGVRDILPPESALWNRVEQIAGDVFATYGFQEIRLPVFEQTELFARSVGLDTDIVQKEMYSFEDHDFPDLEKLRAVIVYRNPDIGNSQSVSLYEDQVTEFIKAFASGLSEKRVPATPDNERALENLRLHIARLDFMRQDLAAGDQNALVRFNLQVVGIREALRAIRFGDVITLRPEATASVVRAYIEHGMHTQPGDVKLYYVGPMFRRERPQKGRFRQFYQIGAEALGKGVGIAMDAEVIAMLMAFFEMCGLSDHTLFINSIGCRSQECRPAYLAKLRTELLKVKGSLGADSQRRIETNPLRVLDSKIREEQEVIERLPRISDNLCVVCRQHYQDLKSILTSRGVKFEENWRLVRGLDYYTETTFEVTVPGLGAQNAICGGGRYDGLVELIGGPKFSEIKGIGFAVGEDRLIEAVRDSGKLQGIRPLEVYIAWMGDTLEKAQELARLLRKNQFGVEVPEAEQRLKKSLSVASRKGARHALIIGEDEVTSGQLTVKRLADGEQKKLSEAELVEFLKSERRG
jgi:histidyl-tRNA synthetase